jgi:hypothetical protein
LRCNEKGRWIWADILVGQFDHSFVGGHGEFNDGNLADPFCERGDHHIKELTLAGRGNVPRTTCIDVPKDHTRCDSGSVIIAG